MSWLVSGFIAVFSPVNLIVALAGCFLGTLVGVLPGLGPTASVALLFPFTAMLSPAATLIGLGAIYYGAMYGGAITAILLNIPGEVAAVPTAMEGYPLAKKGRAGPALVICALSSCFGGTVALICLTFFAPALADMALKFGPFEYFAIMLFSLACAAGLSSGSVFKGLSAAMLGILISLVGVDAATSVYRFTYGSVRLLQGIDVVPIVVGLFGIAEVLQGLLSESSTISMAGVKIQKLMPSRRELSLGFRAALRGSATGTAMGILPGITPSVASFVTYSIGRRVAKERHLFGKGAIEGCAGSEAANNAAAVAGFIPLMALGIPTGPVLAIVLAALVIQGVVPGPLMFTVYRDLSALVIASFFIGNVILLILNIPLVGIWVKIANLPYKWLAPIIMYLCVIGTFVIRNSLFDLWIMLLFGLLGYLAKRTNFPVPPLILGVILGAQLETYFRQSATMGFSMLAERPIAIVVLFSAAAVVLLFSIFKGKVKEEKG
jgi:putative tricarboxylic transport membrane protein